MSLKILLADDNITAQRLGSKILTDAGHEVIAVSNGAAAVKKIASDKPHLLILDVYMPGYSGLEVCDKVKNDPTTAQIPVILTVTNMEPFNPQEGHKVRSDGLMIKPFEASDLLAVVQKYESKSSSKAKADYPETVKMQAVEEFKDASYEEWKAEAADEEETAKIEVPHDMAASPALGFDEHAPEPAHVDEVPPAPAFAEPAPAAAAFEVPAPAAAPAFSVDEHAPAFNVDQHAPALDLSAHADPSAPIDIHAELAGHAVASSEPIDAHAVLSAPVEFEPTSAAPIDVQVSQAAELETTLVATPEVAIAQDPGLVTDADEMSQFVTHVGQEHPETDDLTIGVALPGLTGGGPAPSEFAHVDQPAAEAHDALYATTVKMAAYREPEPVAEAVVAATAVEEEMHRAFAATSSGAAAAPALEHQPEAVASAPAGIPDDLVQQFAAELDQAHQEREAMAETEPEPTASQAAAIEASLEVAKEIPASQLDEEKIASAVNRALERYKEGLRAELIQSIVRELKG